MLKQTISSLSEITQVKLTYRNKIKPGERFKVYTALDAFNIFIKVWDLNRIELLEEFKIMLLDKSAACIGISEISMGGISETTADAKIVFATALKGRASSLILAHNHPSGNLRPSQADIALTKQFCRAGKLLSIDIRDHLIIAPSKYISMANRGYMPQ